MFTILSEAYDYRGLSAKDIEALGLFERIELVDFDSLSPDNRFWLRIMAKPQGVIGIRRYSRNLDKTTDYMFLDLRTSPVTARFDIKKTGNRYNLGRRSITWAGKNAELTLGNYKTAEGFGLAIGGFDYQPNSGFDRDDPDFNLLRPVNNYYNGINLCLNSEMFRSRIYYSDKRYDDVGKTFFGSGIGFKSGTLKSGVAVGLSRLNQDDIRFERLAAGFNFEIIVNDYSLAGEYAVVEKSGGLFLKGGRQIDGLRIDGEFWRYARHFDNFNCSGPAASDYNSYYPGQFELGFRNAQADETGMAVKYTTKPVSMGVQLWSHSSRRKINSSFNLKIEGKLLNQLSMSIQTIAKARVAGGYLWSKIRLMPDWPYVDQTGVKLYFMGENEFVNKRSYGFLNFTRDLNKNLNLFLKIRYYFDGQFCWNLGEDIMAAGNINLFAEITHENYTRVNLRIEKSL